MTESLNSENIDDFYNKIENVDSKNYKRVLFSNVQIYGTNQYLGGAKLPHRFYGKLADYCLEKIKISVFPHLEAVCLSIKRSI